MTWKIRGPFASLLSACVLLLLVGCGRVQGQFIVLQNQVPQTGCSVPAEPSSQYRPDGVLDVSIVNNKATAGYLVFPLLENDLPGSPKGQVDGNRIALSNWVVSVGVNPNYTPPGIVSAFNQDASLTSYTLPTSGSVASGGGHTASVVDVFPPELVGEVSNAMANGGGSFTAYATIHAIGNTINGSIQSDDFVFPISVCSGCLIGNQSMCPFRSPPANLGNPCNPAQDDIVDCCTVSANLFCPPSVSP
jgi:hypothetical protein